MDVSGRVANALQHLVKGPLEITYTDGMQIRMTRQEIGLIVGCAREMVDRAIKILPHQGDIEVKGKNIVVRGARLGQSSPRLASADQIRLTVRHPGWAAA